MSTSNQTAAPAALVADPLALRAEIVATLTRFLRDVIGEEWADKLEITEHSSFNSDLELESIEFVSLAEKMQGHYGDKVDFVSWLSDKEIDEIIGLNVAEVADFIVGCLTSPQTA